MGLSGSVCCCLHRCLLLGQHVTRKLLTVLFLPEGWDPHGLLTAGVGGTRPPTWGVRQHGDRTWCHDQTCAKGHMMFYSRGALILLWQGAAIPEGCDRATRVLIAAGHSALVLHEKYSTAGAEALARVCAERLGGEVFIETSETEVSSG